MTRFPFDQFAKDYLKELLSPLGQVETSQDVPAEVRQIDVSFTPRAVPVSSDWSQQLGLLGRIASGKALLEPYRNPVTISEVRSCLNKQLSVCAELERRAKRENRSIEEEDYPMLWILTPTLSQAQLQGWGASAKINEGWLKGVYFLPPFLRMAIVVIHQLDEEPETLWLRMLGRGTVQKAAIEELTALPDKNPLKLKSLELLYNLQAHLQLNRPTEVDEEDEVFFMALELIYQRELEAAVERGIEQGIEQGIERGIERGRLEGRLEGVEEGIERGRVEGQRSVLENFLRVRLDELDSILTLFLTPIATLPAAEFAMLLVRLSMLSVEENGTAQARELLAQVLLRMRFDVLEDGWVPRLLGLDVEVLGDLLSRWGELVDEEVLSAIDRPWKNRD